VPDRQASQAGLIHLTRGLSDVCSVATVLKRIREWTQLPVLILTVQDDEEDKVALLDAGQTTT